MARYQIVFVPPGNNVAIIGDELELPTESVEQITLPSGVVIRKKPEAPDPPGD